MSSFSPSFQSLQTRADEGVCRPRYRGNLGDYESPWGGAKCINLEIELELAREHRDNFMTMIKNFSEADLENVKIIRNEVGQEKQLGDYLNRIAYHESVHTGQMLDYMRTIGIPRPKIWD